MRAGRYKPCLLLLTILYMLGCRANSPSPTEEKIASETKQVVIGGKDVKNPIPDSDSSVKTGAMHFQHHCQICHGLDGQNSGVPFAGAMNPPVANLAMKDVQAYADGQLKWIIENGIRYSGMPAWKGILEDEEMWHIVHFIRHLPAKGSLGTPDVYREGEQEHTAEKKQESHSRGHRH